MMMKKLLMVFLLASSSTGVQAASFDCSKATYQAEKAVCATSKLSQLDEQMAKLFFAGKNKSSNPSEFTRVQMDWIKGVRLCEADTVCLERSYTQRIEQLSQAISSSTSASANSTSTGQGSQLSQLNGEWYSTQWKYGYTLTNGVGVATSTNSPNFKIGDRIIFLQQSSDKTFEGTQVYTDGKFYKITVQQQSNDTLLFKGERNVSWTMTKKTQTTAQGTPSTTSTNAQATTSTTLATASPVTPLAPANSLPVGQSNLPPCQGAYWSWHMCLGSASGVLYGEKYVGEWKDGKRNGQGTYSYGGDARYVGEFKDGERHGQGTFTVDAAGYSSGQTQYFGEWRDGKRNGKGTNTFVNGDKYVGEFKNDKRYGQGTLTYANGDKYVGEFKDEEFNGQGTYTFFSGNQYVGGQTLDLPPYYRTTGIS